MSDLIPELLQAAVVAPPVLIHFHKQFYEDLFRAELHILYKQNPGNLNSGFRAVNKFFVYLCEIYRLWYSAV